MAISPAASDSTVMVSPENNNSNMTTGSHMTIKTHTTTEANSAIHTLHRGIALLLARQPLQQPHTQQSPPCGCCCCILIRQPLPAQ